MPWADGRSFLDLLNGDGTGLDEMLHVQFGSWNGVRTLDRFYVRWDDGTQALYAYRDDPWLMDDLAAVEPDEVARLDARLDEWLIESTKPSPKTQGEEEASRASAPVRPPCPCGWSRCRRTCRTSRR